MLIMLLAVTKLIQFAWTVVLSRTVFLGQFWDTMLASAGASQQGSQGCHSGNCTSADPVQIYGSAASAVQVTTVYLR